LWTRGTVIGRIEVKNSGDVTGFAATYAHTRSSPEWTGATLGNEAASRARKAAKSSAKGILTANLPVQAETKVQR
jgi:hypothetical protein